MKIFNRQVGSVGEKAAENYLLKKGYKIISRNLTTRFGEIDLIARDHDILVFVEIKTKKGVDFGPPEEMFTKSKYEKVKRMATTYLEGREVPCRIDMVAVVLDSGNFPISINHYENVYPL